MKNRNLRTKIKIGAWTAAFALAAAIGFGACTNASDSSGGNGDAGETQKYAVHFRAATPGGAITAALDDGTEINSGDTVEKGKTVTFTAKPHTMDSWHIKRRQVKSWSIAADDGSTPVHFIRGGTENSIGAQAVIDRSVTVQVEFESEFVPPAAGNIRISIAGDERVDTIASDFTDIESGKKWSDIKAAVEAALRLKSEWQDDYGIYEWRIRDENGTAINDSNSFTESTTVYAVTNYTKFKTVTVGGDTVLTGYEGKKPQGHIILPNGITKIGYNAFLNCSDLTGQLVIPEGVTLIDAGAFSGCEKLEKLILPSTLTSIGGFAFYHCKNLAGELVLHGKLTYIGQKAFTDCSNLSGELVLPASLTTLGDLAFNDCSKLTSVKILFTDIADTTKMKSEAFGYFNNMSNITQITVKTDAIKNILKGYGISESKITVASTI